VEENVKKEEESLWQIFLTKKNIWYCWWSWKKGL